MVLTSQNPPAIHPPSSFLPKSSTAHKKTLPFQNVKHNPTRINLQKYQQALAKAYYTIKKETWRNYISKLNNKTPINKTWEIIGKISGRKLQTTRTYLNTPNRGKSTNKKEIANQIAAEFSQTHHPTITLPNFQKYKNIAEKEKLNLTSNNKENNFFHYHRIKKTQ